MQTYFRMFLSVCLLASAYLLNIPLAYAHTDEQAATPIIITPQALKWGSFDAFPSGAEGAILSGDPRRAGPFLMTLAIDSGC